MTPRPGIGILEESTDVNVFRRLWSVVRKPRKSARAHSGRSAATGGHVGNRSLDGGGVADLMAIHRVVVSKVGVSEKSRSRVFVVGEVVGREAESRVVHVIVVNLLRVHGTHQVRHLEEVLSERRRRKRRRRRR